jgi:hypothetical protein
MYRRNKLTFYMRLVKTSSKLEGINLIRNIYDNKLVYFLLIYNKLLYMIIFLSSYRAKSSELGLAQDQLVFQSSYIRCSYSAHFLLSRSPVELQNALISSRSRVSSFSCSPTCDLCQYCKYQPPNLNIFMLIPVYLGSIWWNLISPKFRYKCCSSVLKSRKCTELENMQMQVMFKFPFLWWYLSQFDDRISCQH